MGYCLFTERFKEIQEAYETLVDDNKRKTFDEIKNNNSSNNQNNSEGNFNPKIDFFQSNKQSFGFDEEVTFVWKTSHADKIVLNPFGVVQPTGQKTYKIKDFKNISLIVELIAENSIVNKQTRSTLTLINNIYKKHNYTNQKSSQEKRNSSMNSTLEEKDKSSEAMLWIPALILISIVILIILLFGISHAPLFHL